MNIIFVKTLVFLLVFQAIWRTVWDAKSTGVYFSFYYLTVLIIKSYCFVLCYLQFWVTSHLPIFSFLLLYLYISFLFSFDYFLILLCNLFHCSIFASPVKCVHGNTTWLQSVSMVTGVCSQYCNVLQLDDVG